MSDKEGSDERSPTEKDTAAKKTTDDNSDRDEDAQAPSASKSCSSASTTKAGDDAPPPAESTAPTSSEASSSRVEPPASSKSTKSRAKSPLKQLGSSLLSLFGKGGSPKDPSASPRKSQSQPGSSGSKLFRPQSPEGQQTYAMEELERIAEYYRKNSFLNRGVGKTEHVPFGPEVAGTLPATTPPETSEPMDSTAPSSIDVASTVEQYPNLASIAMSQSKASSTEVTYPNLASIAKSQSEAASSAAKPKLSKAVLASSTSSSSSGSVSYSTLWSSSTQSLTTSSSFTSHSKMASRSTVSSCLPPSPEDGVHLSTSGPQSTIVRDDSSSRHSPDLPEMSELQTPPVRQQSPPPPTNETEEERLKRMRSRGEPRK
ncbi:sericin-2-like [Dermacentor silvarum]|uniref:sericin-2-like n=1 Tax=Dermacentor silvarum TaxID=543639 RepID=UPI00189870F7|nr:sericin-2-like [Dermacentor silvarum]